MTFTDAVEVTYIGLLLIKAWTMTVPRINNWLIRRTADGADGNWKAEEAMTMPSDDPDSKTCACGHGAMDHGGDPEFPGASDCNVDDCLCVAFDGGSNE